MNGTLLIIASALQMTMSTVELPEAERPLVRLYEACINGWADTPQASAMTAADFQVFAHRQCARERLSAFHAMDGSITDEKEAEAGMQRLKLLEATWIERNRSRRVKR